MNLTADLIEHPRFRLAVFAVLCINPAMTETDLNTLQREPFSLRIHAECNCHSCTQRGQQERMGARPLVRAANFLGLVGD